MSEMNLCCRKLNVVGIFLLGTIQCHECVNFESCNVWLGTSRVVFKIRTQASKGFAFEHQRRKLLQSQ